MYIVEKDKKTKENEILLNQMHMKQINKQLRAIADVAVRKPHQWLDEILIIFYPGNQLSYFQENFAMQYTLSSLNAIQFALHVRLGTW